MREVVKVHGQRLFACGADTFANKVRNLIPADLREALVPILGMIGSMTEQIRAYDGKIDRAATARSPD